MKNLEQFIKEEIEKLKKILTSNFQMIWDKEIPEQYRKDHCAYIFGEMEVDIDGFLSASLKRCAERMEKEQSNALIEAMAMFSENMQRQHLGQSMAYSDVDFVKLITPLKGNK